MKRSIVAALLTGISLQASAEPNAPPQAVPQSLRVCAAEKDDAVRLACFDREIARLSEKASEDPATAEAKPPAAPVAAEQRFGNPSEVIREERKRREATEPQLTQLEATVAALSARPHGELIITLDNGQVWAQVLADEHFSLGIHDKVTIRPGALGSFTLSAPTGRATKVRRLR